MDVAGLRAWVRRYVAANAVEGGDITDGDKGDIVVSGSGATWLLDTATSDALKARANHTGTQTASTISDFSEAVDDRVNTLIVDGSNITTVYDDGAGTLTISASGAGGSGVPAGFVDLDSYSGANDSAKLSAAMTDVQASSTNTKGIQFPDRNVALTTTITPYQALRFGGNAGAGSKSLEIGGGTGETVPNMVTVAVGEGSSSLFYTNAVVQSFNIRDFAFKGNTSSQFFETGPSAAQGVYPGTFADLNLFQFEYCFGRPAQKYSVTQNTFSGNWQVHGFTETPFTLGGADCNYWTEGYLNITNPGTPDGAGKYLMRIDNLQKSYIANIFFTATDGWRPMLISGSPTFGTGLGISNCRFEGANTGDPCDGNALRITGGVGSIDDCWFAYAMVTPSGTEHGVIEVTGGDWVIDRPFYNRGSIALTVPFIYCSGGKVEVKNVGMQTGPTEIPIAVQTTGGEVICTDGSCIVQDEAGNVIDQTPSGEELTTGQNIYPTSEILSSSTALTNQGMRLTYFTAAKTETVASVRTWTGSPAAGATPTLCRIGIYTVATNGDLALVASTANDTALWNAATTGFTKALSASYGIVKGRKYAIGFLIDSAAAMPALVGGSASVPADLYDDAPRMTGNVTGQTNLPSTVTAASVAASGQRPFAQLLP